MAEIVKHKRGALDVLLSEMDIVKTEDLINRLMILTTAEFRKKGKIF